MKKKFPAIILMTLFLGSAGAFYYEGSPENVVATEEKPDTKAQIGEFKESFKEEVKVQAAEVQEPVIEKVEGNDSEKKNDPAQKQPPLKAQEKESKPDAALDTIKIGDSTYMLVDPEEKFLYEFEVAKKYGAKLYGIPNSDLFAYIKDGKAIVHTSTGIMSAPLKYANMVAELVGEHKEYKNFPENVLFSAETGAKVSVVLDHNLAYATWVEDGRIIASW